MGDMTKIRECVILICNSNIYCDVVIFLENHLRNCYFATWEQMVMKERERWKGVNVA